MEANPAFVLEVAVAVFSAFFAVLVLSGGPRRAPNQFLAFFLLLIAGNQAVQSYRELVGPQAVVPLRLATIFALLDPFFLYYFIAIFPQRSRLADPRAVAAVALPPLLLLVLNLDYFHAAPADPNSLFVFLGWSLFTATVYTVLLLHLRTHLFGPRRRAYQPLFTAMALVAIPAVLRALAHVASSIASFVPGGASPTGVVLFTAARYLLFSLLMGALLWDTRRRAQRATGSQHSVRPLTVAILGGILLAVALDHPVLLYPLSLMGIHLPSVHALSLLSGGVAVRWVLFGLFTSVAVLRHDLLGMNLPARRRAARALVGLAFAYMAALAVVVQGALFPAESSLLDAGDVVILAVILLISKPVRGLVDHVAAWVYEVPPPNDPSAAIETYRLAVEQAVREGRRLDVDADLQRLQGELDLDHHTAKVVRRMAQSQEPARLQPGRLVGGRYQLVRLLGRGASGRAYLAHDELLDRRVVIKALTYTDDRGQERALQEARAAGKLHHPNVVTVHDVLTQPGQALLVTEWVEGGSLADRVEQVGQLPPSQGIHLLDGILAGLHAVHQRGVIHRDLKPSNILLAADGTPKIADFGIARIRRGITVEFDEEDAFVGTPDYMAPEQRRGEIATVRTDLFAVALVAKHCLQPLPPRAQAAVERALAEDPGDRWASAASMRSALTTGTTTASGQPR